MKKYIDKSALVAEIKKHQAIWDGMDGDYCKGQRLAYSDILSFLDTLEVKEEVTTTDALIDKACEWLIDNIQNYTDNGMGEHSFVLVQDLKEDFKQAMKGGEK